MLKIAAIICLISFTAFAQASESFKLLLRDKHAAAIIAYLDSVGIESADASPFADYQRSEELVVALAHYAALMEETIYQKREQLANGGVDAAAGFTALLDAKIRRQMALKAVQEMKPEHFLASTPEGQEISPEKPVLADVGPAQE